MANRKQNKITASEQNKAVTHYPALCEMPDTAREIMILRVIGMTQDAIAKRLGVSQSAISQAISRYDPDGVYKPNMDLQKEVIKTSLGSVGLEAVRILMSKIDDLEEYTPLTLLNLIGKVQSLKNDLGGGVNAPSNIKEALENLAGH